MRPTIPTQVCLSALALVGEADGSTLFLDEIELHRVAEPLLRVLDEGGDYQRLGDSRRRRADVRLFAATNRPLAALATISARDCRCAWRCPA